MDNAWIIAFYKETDPVKRLELLKANTGDGESEKDKYRKQLWIARYGKRTPVKDEFMRCLMEMKYLAEGTTVDLGGKRRKQGAKIAATLGLSESLLQEKAPAAAPGGFRQRNASRAKRRGRPPPRGPT